ncbi:MAG: hypothetical protein IT169_10790 [Bryobacterales bacterium]|nr:hypothetical protein [Bryobacterales bacterium]
MGNKGDKKWVVPGEFHALSSKDQLFYNYITDQCSVMTLSEIESLSAFLANAAVGGVGPASSTGMLGIARQVFGLQTSSLRENRGPQSGINIKHSQAIEGEYCFKCIVSATELLEWLVRKGGNQHCSQDSKLGFVCIPTLAQNTTLSQSIESATHDIVKSNYSVRLLVSAPNVKSEKVARLCRNIPRDGRLPIQMDIAGEEVCKALLSHISRNINISPDIMRFALLGSGLTEQCCGGNRNMITLLTCGNKILSMDDDSVCLGVRHPDPKPDAISIGAHADYSDIWAFESHDLMRSECQIDGARSVVNEVSRMLDDFPLTELSEIESVINMGICNHFLSSIINGHGYVGAAFPGVLGDCGGESPMPLYALGYAQVNDRVVAEEARVRTLQGSRNILRVCRTTTIVHGGTFMTGMFGLDNRKIIPPFFPMFRNSDGIFGTMCAQLMHGFLCIHLPWAYLHLPEGHRSGLLTPLDAGRRVRWSDYLIAITAKYGAQVLGEDDGGNWRRFGEYLISIGKLTDRSYRSFIRSCLREHISRELMAWNKFICERRSHAECITEAVDEYMSARQGVLLVKSEDVPDEINRKDEEGRKLCRTLLTQYGTVMLKWFEIREAAATFRIEEHGSRLSV